MFKITVAVLSVALLAVPFGILMARNWPTPEQQAQMAAQRAKQQAQSAAQARQAELTREQLINRVAQPYNRMVSMCDYVAQFSYLVPAENLPSKCAGMRAAGSEAIARMRTTSDLSSLSRAVNQFEIEIASPMRNMEASYATVRRIMAN